MGNSCLMKTVSAYSYNGILFENKIKTVRAISLQSSAINYIQSQHRELSNSGSFVSCIWKDCTASTGGAIYFHDNSGSL